MSLIIFSHSDYSYLWEIIQDYISELKDLNPIFVSNDNNNLQKPCGFTKYIEYNDSECYAQRWIKILQNIDYEYILIVHDVQIIVNCDIDKVKTLFYDISYNNIDRCSLNVFNGINIINNDNIPLCELNSAKGKTMTPYDVCPAIWKKTVFLNLWLNFPNETYRESELNDKLQYYCSKLKCYGLQKTNEKIHYCLGRPHLDFFKILYITIKSELLSPIEVYMDMKDDLSNICDNYYLNNKIKKSDLSYQFILDNFTPL